MNKPYFPTQVLTNIQQPVYIYTVNHKKVHPFNFYNKFVKY